jgi:hypothetical protein
MTHGYAMSTPGRALGPVGAEPGHGGPRQAQSPRVGSLPVRPLDWPEGSRKGATWPGKGYGIRPPFEGETPLSVDEVAVALNQLFGQSKSTTTQQQGASA